MWEQIRANRNWSAGLALLLMALLLAVGWAAGILVAEDGRPGLAIAALVWLVLLLTAVTAGDSLLLSVAKAREIKPEDHPRLWNVVEEMKIASGLPAVPRVFVVDDPAPNAFAVGRSPRRAAIAVTTGLLQRLDRDELQGVVAHETAHVHNRDVRLMMYAGIMVGAIVILADVMQRHFFWGGGRRRSRGSGDGGGQAMVAALLVSLALMILAPLLARLIYLAISRRREYLADASAARFTRYPEGLASALEKIAAAPERLQAANRATAPMYIVNPLRRAGRAAADLSSTHPPISERVRILRAMGGAAYADYDAAWRRVTGRKRGLPPSALREAAAVPSRAAGEALLGGATPAGTAAALVGATATPAAVAPAPGPDADALARAREVGDMMWKLDGYAVVQCPCGVKLKIPPGLVATRVHCPACGREQSVPPPRGAASGAAPGAVP